MKSFTVCLFLIGICSTQLTQAALTQKLHCGPVGDFKAVDATMVVDSNYVWLKDVHFAGGFIYADLVCSSASTLTGVQCSGYLNNRALILASFSQQADQSVAFSYASPTNPTVKSLHPLVCAVE